MRLPASRIRVWGHHKVVHLAVCALLRRIHLPGSASSDEARNPRASIMGTEIGRHEIRG